MKISLQQTLPAIEIKSKGEIQLISGKLRYAPWHSDALYSKVRTIIHTAGSEDALNLNQPLLDALQAQHFDAYQYQTTVIVNLKDASWGTGAIMCNHMEQTKRDDPASSFVLDEKGVAVKAWGLARDSSAVILLDEYGEVMYGKDGVLCKEEINQMIELLRHRISANSPLFPAVGKYMSGYAAFG